MPVSLGKRKERDDETKQSARGTTLFVSNLPYTATSTDLNTLFSDLAPVRSAFVVLEPGSGASKGVGYVSFAIREDAQLAFEKVTEEGLALDGRSLRAQWANSKGKDRSPNNEKSQTQLKTVAETPAPRLPQISAPKDPLAIRTVVISGLPTSLDSKALWKKIRKLDGAETVEWPIKASSGEADISTAHALFSTPASATEAVTKLHAHVFKGSLLSATLKKRLDGLAKASKRLRSSAAVTQKTIMPKSATAPSRASRLIVRNLPFDITEQDLRAVFLPYGPIHLVDVPLKTGDGSDSADAKPRGKGFAFVWMFSRKDAERAMEGVNGIKVQAGMAARMVTDKQKKKRQRREEERAAMAEKGQGEEDAEEEGEGKGRHWRERVVAVDWALSKDKWKEEKARMEVEEGTEVAEDAEMTDGSGSEDGSDSDGEQGDSEHIGVHDGSGTDAGSGSGSEEDDEVDGEDGEEDQEERAKPALPPPESGTTLFIRNVPFEATEDELRTLFRVFGPLRYARITVDHETERSRGTGFVCFWNKTDADKAIEQSEILRTETLGDKEQAATRKTNPFKLPSLLTPDPSASVAQSLVLHGRTLDVTRAVTRDEASKLKEAGERQREKADKRNLYLLREGIILPNSPAAESMDPGEVERRTQSYNARRTLLRSKPSLYVSRTRLSVRQLPLFVTERMLKRLAVHAVRAFEQEVKDRARDPLSSDELAEPAAMADDDSNVKTEADEAGSKTKGKGKERPVRRDTGVKQAKIVRQADRVDPVTEKGRSRGYGFLEMTTHADALRVLRWANSNPGVGRLFGEWWKAELEDLVKGERKKPQKDEARLRRLREEIERGAQAKSRGTLIIEFSIENVQVVQRRATQQREKQQSQEKGASKQRQRRASLSTTKTEPVEERPTKKRRVSEPQPQQKKPSEPTQTPKAGTQIGSLIGRKRKERKTKRGHKS